MKLFINFFSGLSSGVLFGAAPLYWIPVADERMNSTIRSMVLKTRGNDQAWYVDFPWVELLASCSLFFVYFLETIWIRWCVSFRAMSKNKEEEESFIELEEKMEEVTTHDDEAQDLDHVKYSQLAMTSLLSSVILWLSLSTFSLFESLSLGAVSDTKQIWVLLAVNLSSKVFEAFLLGRTIARGFSLTARLNWKHLVYIGFVLITFSCVAPVGISFGIGISATGFNKNEDLFNLISGAALAVASGAFMFVTILEVMADGHNHEEKDEEGEAILNQKHSEGRREKTMWHSSSFIMFLAGLGTMSFLGLYA